MLQLKDNPTLLDLQQYVQEMAEERNFHNDPLSSRCLLLVEEVGELMKSVRKSQGIKIDPASQFGGPDEELADILILLCSVANALHIDLESAFRAKEEKNKKRRWV